MARIAEPSAEDERAWEKWVSSRPANVRAVAEKFDPWSLYRMRSTGHRVTIYSFSEGEKGEVTLTVNVTADFNMLIQERRVFGVDPLDLEPCELPDATEPTGSLLTDKEMDENIDVLRTLVRPDLWELGADGKARRKNN
jgi:hypothetical protein